MSLLRYLILIFILSVHPSAFSQEEECTKSTNAVNFSKSDNEFISQHFHQADSERVLTFFKNGDLLISSVADCGLGLELLYLSQLPFESVEQKANKLKWLLALNGRDLTPLIPQEELNKAQYDFSFKGELLDELHIVKNTQLLNSDEIFPETFSESISYIWVAPSGME